MKLTVSVFILGAVSGSIYTKSSTERPSGSEVKIRHQGELMFHSLSMLNRIKLVTGTVVLLLIIMISKAEHVTRNFFLNFNVLQSWQLWMACKVFWKLNASFFMDINVFPAYQWQQPTNNKKAFHINTSNMIHTALQHNSGLAYFTQT